MCAACQKRAVSQHRRAENSSQTEREAYRNMRNSLYASKEKKESLKEKSIC